MESNTTKLENMRPSLVEMRCVVGTVRQHHSINIVDRFATQLVDDFIDGGSTHQISASATIEIIRCSPAMCSHVQECRLSERTTHHPEGPVAIGICQMLLNRRCHPCWCRNFQAKLEPIHYVFGERRQRQ